MREHYPFKVLREGADLVFSEFERAFEQEKRFIIFHGLTGSGKSGYAVAAARKYGGIILTPTKILQRQYAETKEFDREYTIFGKSNYSCGLKGLEHYTVDQAVCVSNIVTDTSRDLIPFTLTDDKATVSKHLRTQCVNAGICEYYKKLDDLGKVPGAVANYDLILRIKKFPGKMWGLDVGDVAIFDEAHQLIEKTKEIFGFKFSNIAAKRLFGGTDEGVRKKEETVISWLQRLSSMATSRHAKEKDPKVSSRYDNFIKRVGPILAQELSNEKKFFIEDGGTEFEIKPLDMRFLKEKLFFPFKHVILMSATLPSNFKEIFGIRKEECVEIRLDSTFKKENRPIFFATDLPKMNKDTVLTNKSPAIQLLDKVLEHHKDEKGIIHTANYKFMHQLRKCYKGNNRFIWVSQDDDKDRLIKRHSNSDEPTILVSPAMMEGVDLKDDLARFGVLLKIPYPMLDEYTKRMMKIYPSWYSAATATNICQSYGRQVRSKDDKASFYILDGQFDNCISRSKECYSDYFLEAVKVGTSDNLIKNVLKKAG